MTGRRGASRARWITPLAAAASVIAVVAGSALATGILTTSKAHPGQAHSGRAGQHSAPSSAAWPQRSVYGLPAYFLEVPESDVLPISPTDHGGSAVPARETTDIVSTATGQTAATATLPGYVYRVAADSERRWTTPRQYSQGSMSGIAWLADGRTLAVSWYGPSAPQSFLRLLDTAAPDSDLLSGRPVLPLSNAAGGFSDFIISPNGRLLVGTMQYPKGPFGVAQGRATRLGEVIEFSARTGQPRIAFRPPAVWDKAFAMTEYSHCYDPPWIGNSGQKMLLTCTYPRPKGQDIASIPHTMLLDHGRVIQLPWLDQLAQGMAAFGS